MYKYYINLLRRTNLFKTFFVNFKVFPFKVALRLPILVAWNTHVQGLKNAQFQGANSFATYKFGFPMDLFRNRTANTYLDFRGKVVFKGRCSLGKGSKVIVDRNGYVQFGRNFSCTGGVNMECHQSVVFGDNNVLSWDITILDTDFHPILSQDNKVLNCEKPICIGNDVWIGCKAILLKGIHIADGTVIAAGTVVTQSVETPHAVIGNEGSKLRYLKTNIRWSPECL